MQIIQTFVVILLHIARLAYHCCDFLVARFRLIFKDYVLDADV